MKVTKQLVVLTVSALLLCPASAKGGETTGHTLPSNIATLRLTEGMSFLSARRYIVKSGWTPIRMHISDQYEYSGAERRLVERNMFEVDFCSVDRGALCILYYAKGKSCLQVDTVGEQVQWMRVTGWSEKCPEAQHSADDNNQQ